MQLACEVCRAPLRPEDVRLDIAVAKCHACNAVYDLSGRKARGLTVPAQDKPRLVRAKAPLPPKFRVDDDGTRTCVSWRWFTFGHVFLIFFCIAWDSFLFTWYGIALSAENTPLIAVLFPVAHVAVGVGLSYYTLAGLVNRTKIEVSRDRLTIRHGPLPWRGNLNVLGRRFTQLYGVETVASNKGRDTFTYELIGMERSGRAVKLLTGLTEKDHVLYLEQILERRLGIEDAPVDGEIATRVPAA
ncbi:hypothetical protein [Stigmatella aurantiaca]|uniref:Conserved uncharacterized protein n=1 Tax=Stigmatella aurantiaca (strain DW4/3-1) TaxID=378806 RepID=Q093M9_STIAD|nr:hypothetical protein [Stigmatella aurantiaca]ADO72726.1 conserved uncharacterized protein [Stigmatella aurantiaca DW4/3-1]EAU66923.1 conserved hypothetical protein [Stigmatella aurantiaca DW4/3-1]